MNLDNIQMNVVQTAAHGVVNQDTIFHFSQEGSYVEARYAGGKIRSGFLLGTLEGNKLSFSYCQLQIDGVLDHGQSKSEVSLNKNGKYMLIEHFEWGSRAGEKGTNVFEQL